MKCYPWFKDYIGTIVGTPIQVVMLTDKAMPYRFGKKKKYMQNMSWLFVLSTCTSLGYGLDRTTPPTISEYLQRLQRDQHELSSTVAREVLRDWWRLPNYARIPGSIQNCRIIYRSKSRVCCSKEIFNYVHSSLGNIIERCFHVLKVHFLILKRITPYSLQTQVLIVVLAASYNCIRHEM